MYISELRTLLYLALLMSPPLYKIITERLTLSADFSNALTATLVRDGTTFSLIFVDPFDISLSSFVVAWVTTVLNSPLKDTFLFFEGDKLELP